MSKSKKKNLHGKPQDPKAKQTKKNDTGLVIALSVAVVVLIALVVLLLARSAAKKNAAELTETDLSSSLAKPADQTVETPEILDEAEALGIVHAEIEIEGYGTIKLELDGPRRSRDAPARTRSPSRTSWNWRKPVSMTASPSTALWKAS